MVLTDSESAGQNWAQNGYAPSATRINELIELTEYQSNCAQANGSATLKHHVWRECS